MTTSTSPVVHTRILVYTAVQVAFLAFLSSYFKLHLPMPDLMSPTKQWLREKADDWHLSDMIPMLGTVGGRRRPMTLFSREQLAQYDGTADSIGVYLAVLGRVYNVKKGIKHYGPGGGYHFFAGKDATRAFVTGDFSVSGLIDDVSGLSHQDMLGIEEWQTFYERDYEFVGLLIGTYYDAKGMPTEALRAAEKAIDAAHRWKLGQQKESEIFPPCNSEWHKDQGGRVWCSSKSGGIQRDWTGVPRKLFKPASKDYRCACVKNFGAPLADPGVDSTEDMQQQQKHRNRGDLDNPNLQEYPACSPTSNSCKLPQD